MFSFTSIVIKINFRGLCVANWLLNIKERPCIADGLQ